MKKGDIPYLFSLIVCGAVGIVTTLIMVTDFLLGLAILLISLQIITQNAMASTEVMIQVEVEEE